MASARGRGVFTDPVDITKRNVCTRLSNTETTELQGSSGYIPCRLGLGSATCIIQEFHLLLLYNSDPSNHSHFNHNIIEDLTQVYFISVSELNNIKSQKLGKKTKHGGRKFGEKQDGISRDTISRTIV